VTTLFSDIQRLFERTYASTGVNLAECLIDRRWLRFHMFESGNTRRAAD